MKLEELLEFKAGVLRDGVHPLMWFYLGLVAPYHKELTGRRVRVTSLRRRYVVGVRSKHSPKPPALASAADVGRRALDRINYAESFCRDLQRLYGANLGVVLEPEWLTVRQLERRFGITIQTAEEEERARARVGPHIHLQLKRLELSGSLWVPTAGSIR